MIKNVAKVLSLSVLLASMISFTGCLGIGGQTNTAATTEKNDHQGVFKSTDQGKTWEHKVKIDDQNSIDKYKIASLKMDPQNNKVLYVGAVDSGLYKTENGADTWQKVTDSNNIITDKMTVYDIEIEKGNSDIIYIAVLNNTRGELLKSEDGGKSWVESYIISEAGKPVNRVEIDPLFKNIVYIGTEQGGFIKSENRGKTWATLKWSQTAVKDFVVDFKNNKGFILRTTNEIFKSKDGGASWESLNQKVVTTSKLSIAIPQISSMTIDNINPLVIYITYLNLILTTNDGGYTWTKLNTITPSLTAVGTIPQVKQIGLINSTIYYGAGNVFYKSENKGLSWSSYDIPIKGDVRYTVSDYSDHDVIYVGSFYEIPKKKKR